MDILGGELWETKYSQYYTFVWCSSMVKGTRVLSQIQIWALHRARVWGRGRAWEGKSQLDNASAEELGYCRLPWAMGILCPGRDASKGS